MTTAATYEYIESDFTTLTETLGEFRARTAPAHRRGFFRRSFRRLAFV